MYRAYEARLQEVKLHGRSELEARFQIVSDQYRAWTHMHSQIPLALYGALLIMLVLLSVVESRAHVITPSTHAHRVHHLRTPRTLQTPRASFSPRVVSTPVVTMPVFGQAYRELFWWRPDVQPHQRYTVATLVMSMSLLTALLGFLTLEQVCLYGSFIVCICFGENVSLSMYVFADEFLNKAFYMVIQYSVYICLLSLSQTSLSLADAFATWPLLSDASTFADTFASASTQARDSGHAWSMMLICVLSFIVLCTTLVHVPDTQVISVFAPVTRKAFEGVTSQSMGNILRNTSMLKRI